MTKKAAPSTKSKKPIGNDFTTFPFELNLINGVNIDNDLIQQRLPSIPQEIPQLYVYVIWIILGIIFLGVGSKVAHDAEHVRMPHLCFLHVLTILNSAR